MRNLLQNRCAICGEFVRPLRLSVVVRRYNPDLEYVPIKATIDTDQHILCESCLFMNLRRLFGVWETEMKAKRRTVEEQVQQIKPAELPPPRQWDIYAQD